MFTLPHCMLTLTTMPSQFMMTLRSARISIAKQCDHVMSCFTAILLSNTNSSPIIIVNQGPSVCKKREGLNGLLTPSLIH